MNDNLLLLGAVAYDPKVVTIWDGFKEWFQKHGLGFDYLLYSNYERQVEAHLAGHFHVAWNSPLAWVRAERMARAQGKRAEAIVMRDTDQDLTSVIVVRQNSPIQSIADLKGRKIGSGALDSPQATLLPLSHLRAHGVAPDADYDVVLHDLLGGKHGDHIGGEREAARALMAGTVDAACMIDSNHLLFINEGTLPAGATRVLAQTAPYDHCNFTVLNDVPPGPVARFRELLLGMSYEDATVRPLLDLEGLKKWKPGRISGYRALEQAVEEMAFYDEHGNITVANYRY
ncbi:MAG TPA: phosphate/phosphite/phosphonate ABC transporter substrate-binding protein [Blastocatellia bacterium]|nr:phosphate/phosphite/phosphonate ABC transporter substrate-binding protein [Blastocatellia bacterium]